MEAESISKVLKATLEKKIINIKEATSGMRMDGYVGIEEITLNDGTILEFWGGGDTAFVTFITEKE